MTLKDFIFSVSPVERLIVYKSGSLVRDNTLLYNKQYPKDIAEDLKEQGKDLDDYYIGAFCSVPNEKHTSNIVLIVREAVSSE